MLFQSSVSKAENEEPDANLIPLFLFLFIFCVFNWTLTSQVTNAERYNLRGLVRRKKDCLVATWDETGMVGILGPISKNELPMLIPAD